MKKMCLLVVFLVLVAVPAAFGQQEGEMDYYYVSPSATVSGGPDCDCVAVDCLVDYFYVSPTATDVTNWPESDAAENAA